MAENNTALEASRKQIYQSMNKDLRKIADAMDEKIKKFSLGLVLVRYDLGALVAEAHGDEATYGTEAVATLAAYWGENVSTLYALRGFAGAFTRDFVKDWTERPMANGRFMTESHWIAVSKIVDVKAQEKFLRQTIKNSLTANQLESEIRGSAAATRNTRSGGRPHGIPTSFLSGLQKFGNMTQGIINYEQDMAEKYVWDAIDEVSPDKVNEDLLARLQSTEKSIGTAIDRLGLAKTRVEGNIDRVTTVLKNKTEAPASDADSDASKAESNGKEDGKKSDKNGAGKKSGKNGADKKSDKNGADKKSDKNGAGKKSSKKKAAEPAVEPAAEPAAESAAEPAAEPAAKKKKKKGKKKTGKQSTRPAQATV